MTAAFLFWLLLLLPFAGFFILLVSGKKANPWAGPLACGLTAANLALSAALVLGFSGKTPLLLQFDWFSVGDTVLSFGFYLDSLTATMLLLVPGVALLVQIYSLGYLKTEPDKTRYFAFLQLFTGAMLGLVVTNNLLVLYGFWELVGLASYLLIGFWYRRPTAVQAAKKAFLINRIGDVCLLLGVFGVFRETGGFQFSVYGFQFSVTTSLLLFGGAVGKSAQFPLHTWLPDAMEGPTPVSALLHAATMVAAGIFLLGRLHPALAPDALSVVAVVGAISTLLGAVYALSQTDIKKVLAYSTISQLGLMVLGMGVGARDAALFHLLTHAAFKAGLFLAAGSVIHALHHEQNMMRMGGLRKRLPLTFAAYAVCAAALAGLPLTGGFFSKDALVAASFSWAAAGANPIAWLIPAAALGSAALTAAYLTRQAALVFFGKFRGSVETLNHAQEPPLSMGLPVVLLAVLSLGWVVWLNPFAIGEIPLWVEIGVGLATLGGMAMAGAWFNRSRALPWSVSPWSVSPWSVSSPTTTPEMVGEDTDHGDTDHGTNRPLPTLDVFYEKTVTNPVLRLSDLARQTDRRLVDRAVDAFGVVGVVGAHVVGWFDRTLVDGLVNLTARLAGALGQLTRRTQGGQVQGYVVAALLGLGLVLGWLLVY